MVDLPKLLGDAPLGVVVWSLTGEILFANERFWGMVGREASGGHDYWSLTAEGQKQRELNELHGGEGRWYDKEFVGASGERVSARCRGWEQSDKVFAALVQRASGDAEGKTEAAEKKLRRQNELLLRLAKSDKIDQGELRPALAEICEVAAEGLDVARASVWLYDEAKSKIVCLDLCERREGKHSSGIELLARDYPEYFRALAEDRTISADNARRHPATAEFTDGYLVPLGITSMLDAPIRLGGVLVGVLCNEHMGPLRAWDQEDIAFAGAVADVVSRALEASERSKAEAALQRANEELESRVAQRTAELSAAMEALWGEMELARRIQTALVPTSASLEGFDLYYRSTPAEQVGGDYVDILGNAGGGWLLIGDASGHGVPAGLVMMMCQTAARALLSAQPDLDPRSLLTAINRVLAANIEQLGEDRYMTMSAFHHLSGGNMVYAGLHLEPLVFRAATGQVEVLPSRGMWLGVVPDIAEGTESHNLYLAPGDVLLLYTDGLTEACKEGQMIDLAGLTAALGRLGYQQVEDIGAGITALLDGYEVEDDVTFVVVKRQGDPAATSFEGLELDDLKIAVASADDALTARWLGRSQLRAPSTPIGSFLDSLVDQLGGRRLVLDFRDLEYMNSSTFVPITRVVRRAATARVDMVIRFRPALTWQRAPFEMLARIVGPASTVKLEPETLRRGRKRGAGAGQPKPRARSTEQAEGRAIEPRLTWQERRPSCSSPTPPAKPPSPAPPCPPCGLPPVPPLPDTPPAFLPPRAPSLPSSTAPGLLARVRLGSALHRRRARPHLARLHRVEARQRRVAQLQLVAEAAVLVSGAHSSSGGGVVTAASEGERADEQGRGQGKRGKR